MELTAAPDAGQERSATIRGIGFVLRMLRNTAPGMAMAMMGITLLTGLLPTVGVWISKRVVDHVASGSHTSPGTSLLGLGILYVTVQITCSLLAPVQTILSGLVNERLVGHTNLLVMRKANSFLDLSRFEDPRYYDDLKRISQEAAHLPMSVLNLVTTVLQTGVATGGLLFLIGRFHFLMPMLLLLTALPELWARQRVFAVNWEAEEGLAKVRRRLFYWSWLGTSSGPAKEVRLFGLGGWLIDRYHEAFAEVDRTVWTVRARAAWQLTAFGMLRFAGAAGTFLYLVQGGLTGRLTAGDLVLYIGAAFYLDRNLGILSGTVSGVGQVGRMALKLQQFLESPAGLSSPVTQGTPNNHPRSDIELRDLHFSYPDADREVLSGVSFHIREGETVALVGANGCGKSTLVKLLTRLYDPTAGSVLLGGRDLREHDIEAVRRRIAVVFQDFSRYQVTLGENIGLGAVEALDDQARILAAAESGGAIEVARRAEDGLQTRLGRSFGGAELSGGEWQRVALARAFMRDAEILILDEPTAALDIRTEHEIYQRFAELTRGKTTLLISHRFSTVRMADRIVVLENGRVREEGTHDGLLRQDGLYAELFRLQAQGFQEELAGRAR